MNGADRIRTLPANVGIAQIIVACHGLPLAISEALASVGATAETGIETIRSEDGSSLVYFPAFLPSDLAWVASAVEAMHASHARPVAAWVRIMGGDLSGTVNGVRAIYGQSELLACAMAWEAPIVPPGLLTTLENANAIAASEAMAECGIFDPTSGSLVLPVSPDGHGIAVAACFAQIVRYGHVTARCGIAKRDLSADNARHDLACKLNLWAMQARDGFSAIRSYLIGDKLSRLPGKANARTPREAKGRHSNVTPGQTDRDSDLISLTVEA